jgi:hypothetical protein
MDHAKTNKSEARRSAEVVDFDEAWLESFAPARRADLLAEARMLARVFAPAGDCEALHAMARALSAGAKDREMDRRHARGLAAALRRLAHQESRAA